MTTDYPKTIILPVSGRTATIQRRLKGRDMRLSERAAGKNASSTERAYAMLAQVLLLDGQPIVMEDLDDWDMEDINEAFRALGIVPEEGEENSQWGKSQTPPASPPLSNGDSRRPSSTK